ncbi:MAG: TatD family hydrolase [Chloroflexota bacterium]
MIVDTHCHLDLNRFDDDRAAVVQRSIEAGVEKIIIPALDLQNCQTVLELANEFTAVYAAIGIHPNSSAQWQDSWIEKLRGFTQHHKVVAIGEIGLDYYWDKSPKEIQHQAFKLQLELADKLDLPVIVHNRESDEDVVHLLSQSPLNGKAKPGVLHSFSTTWQIAKRVLDMGFYLGFTGPVTFKKADDLRAVAKKVPLDRILVETDAPFLTPHPYRGKRNEPAYTAFVVEKLAELHGKTVEEMARITTENAYRLFSQLEEGRDEEVYR